jgi:hypothetical protein
MTYRKGDRFLRDEVIKEPHYMSNYGSQVTSASRAGYARKESINRADRTESDAGYATMIYNRLEILWKSTSQL